MYPYFYMCGYILYPYFYMCGYIFRCIHISIWIFRKTWRFGDFFCFYRFFCKYEIFMISTDVFSQIFFIKSEPVAGLR